MSHLRVRALRKTYGANVVVNGIDLDLKPGECFGLLGPNGAGKTTTLRLCLGLTEPDSGEISVLDVPVPQEARRARTRIGVVPQMDNLDPDFTIRENLQIYGRYFDLSAAEVDARIPALLEFAGLASRGNDNIRALSGGMKRRLTLARALINDPDLIFLDEPTTGLDPQARHLIWQRLRQLVAQGKTIFLTTHFMDEAERLCSRLAVMDHGRMIAAGTPRELVERHIEPQVVEVFGDGAEAWAKAQGAQLAERCETAGETVFCYVHDAAPLIADLAARNELRYVHRPANLEDVFLRL
ncbi:MAG: ATP-binding cassette domain-containing protein, partial [Betaproteobacteria bacterium]|nr:ATP-binding cassette domain-containing protein [Betaproteobacteria bacterium]